MVFVAFYRLRTSIIAFRCSYSILCGKRPKISFLFYCLKIKFNDNTQNLKSLFLFLLLFYYIHCNKFLRIYKTNHLNLTLNYTVRVASFCKHWFYLICFIEMFRINPLKSKDFMTSNKFMLTHARYFIYILIHNKLKKVKLYLI